MPPTLTPHAFVAKWRGDTRKERSVSQEYFIDLCRLLGHETPGEKRDRWLNPEGVIEAELKKRTLTNLYNERPTWLKLAHEKLDKAVVNAYGWPHDLSDEEILARLLALNLERAAGQGGAARADADQETND